MTKKLSIRFLCFVLTLVCVLSLIPSLPAMAAENYATGGWAMVRNNTEVVNENGGHVGTVYSLEGVTVLSISGNTAYIEYATSGTPKKGYVNTSCFYRNEVSTTCVGKANTSCSTYYSPSTALRAGSISSGELVAVLATNGTWDYIEYNTTSGRKRAYVQRSNLTLYSPPRLPSFYHVNPEYPQNLSVLSRTTVYGGPSKRYAEIGYVDPGDNIVIFERFAVNNGLDAMVHVSYPATGGTTKYGYIYIADYL